MTENLSPFLPLNVVLEFERVLRAFYGFDATGDTRVFEHLPGLAHVNTEEVVLGTVSSPPVTIQDGEQISGLVVRARRLGTRFART